jgi:hypothetical protein
MLLQSYILLRYKRTISTTTAYTKLMSVKFQMYVQ